MKLGSKIGISTGAVGIMLLILGVSAAYHVLRLQRMNSHLLDNKVSSIRAAVELQTLVRQMLHELDRFLLTHDHALLAKALNQQQEVDLWLEQSLQLSGSNREQTLVAEMQRGLDAFFVQLRQAMEKPESVIAKRTVDRLANELLTEDVLAHVQLHLELNERNLEESNTQIKSMAKRLALALSLLGTCGAIAGLVTGYGMARQVSRSIFQLSVPIRDVAGKLNEVVGPIEVFADPSVAELEEMLQRLSAAVGGVVEQLHARHREAIRADQLAAVGQLAAGLAHELRNPLMCMKTLVQSSRRQGDRAHLDFRDLAVLDEEITRLNNLLQAFLDFARPAKPETEDVDMAHVVRQTVDLLSKKAAAREVTIQCALGEGPLVVHADATQLRQVLLNLLLNALDAVHNGGSIWVEAMRSDNVRASENGGLRRLPDVRVRVSDNGQGLPAGDRSRIFEPFFSTKDTGLGLGLAISQRIIDAHGGELVGQDREGGGAVFEIRLPAQPSATDSRN